MTLGNLRLVLPLIVLILTAGCLGSGGEHSAKTTPSHPETSFPSHTTSTSATSGTTHTTASPHTGTGTSSTTTTMRENPQLEDITESLRGIRSYRAIINTTLNSTVEVSSGGVVKKENVSVISTSEAFFDLSTERMEVNMTVMTQPAGGIVTTKIKLNGDTAFVTSFGETKKITRGEEGFKPILDTFRANPVQLALESIEKGSCRVFQREREVTLRCGDKSALSKIVEMAVGAPAGAEVNVKSGELVMKFQDLTPVGGTIALRFSMSVSYNDASGNQVSLKQNGVIEESFEILAVNG